MQKSYESMVVTFSALFRWVMTCLCKAPETIMDKKDTIPQFCLLYNNFSEGPKHIFVKLQTKGQCISWFPGPQKTSILKSVNDFE